MPWSEAIDAPVVYNSSTREVECEGRLHLQNSGWVRGVVLAALQRQIAVLRGILGVLGRPGLLPPEDVLQATGPLMT